MLRTEGVSFSLGNKMLLHSTSLKFEPRKLHVIMGANGAGKSTLLKLLSGNQLASKGNIFLDQDNINKIAKRELAKKRAMLSQHYQLAFSVSVYDLVMMGRYPYYGSIPSATDKEVCKKAMELMQIEQLAERSYETLSGGEAQKAQMSRVLAQIWDEENHGHKQLFLDEPVSHLDVKYQYQLLNIAKTLNNRNTTVIAILHDINLAISFADRIIMMKEGRVVYDIQDLSLLTSEILQDVFDIKAKIIFPEQHKPVVIY